MARAAAVSLEGLVGGGVDGVARVDPVVVARPAVVVDPAKVVGTAVVAGPAKVVGSAIVGGTAAVWTGRPVDLGPAVVRLVFAAPVRIAAWPHAPTRTAMTRTARTEIDRCPAFLPGASAGPGHRRRDLQLKPGPDRTPRSPLVHDLQGRQVCRPVIDESSYVEASLRPVDTAASLPGKGKHHWCVSPYAGWMGLWLVEMALSG